MNTPIAILGIAGSLRQASYNRAALRAAEQLVPEGARLDIFDLAGIPPFNQDDERNPPARVVELKRSIRSSDAILLVTPEYNYSIPGVLKNAIDWASRPYGDNSWEGKPVAVMGASAGRSEPPAPNTTCARSSYSSTCRGESARSDDFERRGALRRPGQPQGREHSETHSQPPRGPGRMGAATQRGKRTGAAGPMAT